MNMSRIIGANVTFIMPDGDDRDANTGIAVRVYDATGTIIVWNNNPPIAVDIIRSICNSKFFTINIMSNNYRNFIEKSLYKIAPNANSTVHKTNVYVILN